MNLGFFYFKALTVSTVSTDNLPKMFQVLCTFPSFLLSFKYFLLNAGVGLTSVKSKITLWFRINNVNPGLLRVRSITPKSSVPNLLLTPVTVIGRISGQTPLQN